MGDVDHLAKEQQTVASPSAMSSTGHFIIVPSAEAAWLPVADAAGVTAAFPPRHFASVPLRSAVRAVSCQVYGSERILGFAANQLIRRTLLVLLRALAPLLPAHTLRSVVKDLVSGELADHAERQMS